jgi:hypothetical protein
MFPLGEAPVEGQESHLGMKSPILGEKFPLGQVWE